MSKDAASPLPLPDDHYFVRSQEPLHALVFLAPLIVIYELGVSFAVQVTGSRLTAHKWLSEFLELFGAAGEYLPGLAVVVVLLAWHVANRDPWRLRPKLYAGMFAESIALALPLVMVALLARGRRAAMLAAAGGNGDPQHLAADIVLSLGAGIYEELLFRLILIAVVHFVLVDLLKATEQRGALVAIALSTVLFAISHFNEFTPTQWPMGQLAFYLIAGLYFSIVYVLRGFGIVVATHAFYDIIVNLLRHGVGGG